MKIRILFFSVLLQIFGNIAYAQNISLKEMFDFSYSEAYRVKQILKKRGYKLYPYSEYTLFARNTGHGLHETPEGTFFPYFKNPKQDASMVLVYDVPGDMDVSMITTSTTSKQTMLTWVNTLKSYGYKFISAKTQGGVKMSSYKKGGSKPVTIIEMVGKPFYSIIVLNPYV